jgi:hypothetical protein
MLELFYLVHQDGDINGEKQSICMVSSIEEANVLATTHEILHYSVEEKTITGDSVVFIC